MTPHNYLHYNLLQITLMTENVNETIEKESDSSGEEDQTEQTAVNRFA